MKKRYRAPLVALAVGATLLTGWLVSATLTSASSPPLVVSKAIGGGSAPVIDGNGSDAIWATATEADIAVAGGANMNNSIVHIKSVYDASNVYFRLRYSDPTESKQRLPWVKQDGAWTKLSTSTLHQENTYYEDKVAIAWDINTASFGTGGCTVLCHAGEYPANSGYGSKYTQNPGEKVDLWHWKSIRTNPDPVNQTDDGYVDNKVYGPAPETSTTAPEAGRHPDPKISGGYSDNVLSGGLPTWKGPAGSETTPPYYIVAGTEQAFGVDAFPNGTEIASIRISPIVGDRGEIQTKGVWAAGEWVLELKRSLSTTGNASGGAYDVQFDPSIPNKVYPFGVAVFDNAQVNHAYETGPAFLSFASAPAAGVIPQTAGWGNSPHGSYTLSTGACAACHRAHTAVGPDLLKAADTTSLCVSCHGGAGANTDVIHGVRSGDQKRLNGGGFLETLPNLGAQGASNDYTLATSRHRIAGLPNSATGAAWGSDPNNATGGVAGTLECTSCHNPHGSTNYRILRDASTTTTWTGDADLLAWVDNQVKSTIDDNVGGGVHDYAVDTTDADYANGFLPEKFTAGVDAGAPTLGMNAFCSTCHKTYLTKAGSGDHLSTDSGYYVYPNAPGQARYRHAVMRSYTPADTVGGTGLPQPLRFASSVVDPNNPVYTGFNCTTCHLAHGTVSTSAGSEGVDYSVAPPAALAGDSALLFYSGRGVCQTCHQKNPSP
ncbi:MAG: hypothetical protein HY874_00320 [Chloroflexi bacterium]|nr:hypothetical protein [Chloroflexota bacterium]